MTGSQSGPAAADVKRRLPTHQSHLQPARVIVATSYPLPAICVGLSRASARRHSSGRFPGYRARYIFDDLAMLESGRRLSVRPELRDHLEHIKEMVVEHYQAHHGELVLWGKIDHYRYHDGRGRVYRISPDGRLLDESGPARGGFEGRAELSVGVGF